MHARRHIHACTCTMHMHAYVRARANPPAHAHALVQTHAHIFWLCANRLGPYSSAVSCVWEDLISHWLLGLVCIALTWPRLRRQLWWLRLSGLSGRCQWEWWRSLRLPTGRAMPYIKMLPLPPPCGSHGPVGGFQQCRVCVLSCWSCLARRLPCRGREKLPVTGEPMEKLSEEGGMTRTLEVVVPKLGPELTTGVEED